MTIEIKNQTIIVSNFGIEEALDTTTTTTMFSRFKKIGTDKNLLDLD